MPSDGEERAGIAEAAPGEATEAPEHPLDPAEAEASEHPDSFDPGPETGYLRKGPRSHELPVEVGAAPFDPGPEVGVDGRRAKRAARRQEKAERKRREHRERIEREHEERAAAEREQSESAEREAAERERRELEAAAAAKHAERESREAERERRERAEAAQRESAAQTKAERRSAEAERRQREEAAKKERRARARAERDAKQREGKLEKQRERARREESDAERRRAEGERLKQAETSRKTAAGKTAVRKAAAGKAAARTPEAGGPQRPARPRPPADPHAAKASHHLVHPHRGPRLATPDAKQASLRRPTAKVVAALAAVAAVALGAGALLGLPLPLVGEGAESPQAPAASAASLAELGAGTPTGLTKGPYHPVVIEDPNYGEAAAKFHADRGGRKHEGQDIFARPGTPLVAVRDGVVVDGGGGQSFYSTGGGNTLVTYSPFDDRSYVYLHMLKPALVEQGETVKAGQLVGQVGCTGSCDGPHLHFEVRQGRAVFGPQKKAIDPLPLLKEWPVRPVGGK